MGSFPDIRQLEHVPGRSINLAMSVRGLSALDSIGLGTHVATEYGIPMHSRMIHTLQVEFLTDRLTNNQPFNLRDS